MKGETYSFGSLYALKSNVGGIKNRTEILIPHPTLLEDEIRVNLKRRDRTRYFIQAYLQTIGCEPSDAGVLQHLNLQRRSGMPIYDWVDINIIITSLALSTEATLRDVDIVVCDPSEWSVYSVLGEKGICNSFDDSMVPFHECLFTRV